MKSFRQYLTEMIIESHGINQVAGVQLGEDKYKFSIKALINHSENFPIISVDPNHLSDNLEGREGEDLKSQKERVKKADTKYPLILTTRDDGRLHVLDGTHRLQQAIENGHDSISARIIPRQEMDRYRISEKFSKES